MAPTPFGGRVLHQHQRAVVLAGLQRIRLIVKTIGEAHGPAIDPLAAILTRNESAVPFTGAADLVFMGLMSNRVGTGRLRWVQGVPPSAAFERGERTNNC